MSFNKEKCVVKKLYCGDGKIPKDTRTKKYSRKGSAYECLKKGYGIAEWENKKNSLPESSLQQITYIGPVYEANFKKRKIGTIKTLMSKTAGMTAKEKSDLVKRCCTKKNGDLDKRAFNAVILYLYDHGQKNLPMCMDAVE